MHSNIHTHTHTRVPHATSFIHGILFATKKIDHAKQLIFLKKNCYIGISSKIDIYYIYKKSIMWMELTNVYLFFFTYSVKITLCLLYFFCYICSGPLIKMNRILDRLFFISKIIRFLARARSIYSLWFIHPIIWIDSHFITIFEMVWCGVLCVCVSMWFNDALTHTKTTMEFNMHNQNGHYSVCTVCTSVHIDFM